MHENWSLLFKTYRQRHGLSQEQLALMVGVSQRTISRWETGFDQPSIPQQKRLRDLGWRLSSTLLASLKASIFHCPVPRALSSTDNIRLEAFSPLALEKRPTIKDWVGRNLRPIACGVLEEILDDRPLQDAIAGGEIASLVTTSRSVLKTEEHPTIGLYRTTISYFFHEGTLYSDAIGMAASGDVSEGYYSVPMDEVVRA